jgi:hypothetical protein
MLIEDGIERVSGSYQGISSCKEEEMEPRSRSGDE